ncbi:MAG: hypothetical protein ABIL18_06065 [candidate division WOR-3 bacterium]
MLTLGSTIPFYQSAWLIATTQIAKYLPGGVWYTVSRIYVGKKENMNGKGLTLSMILETCLLLLANIAIFLVSILLAGSGRFLIALMYVVIVIVLIILLNPNILFYIVNLLLKLLNKPKIDLTISYPQLLHLSLYFFGLWIAQIIGFYFLINSIYPIHISKLPHIASAYTLSWMSGFIVIFAPGGLGVREGMMSLLLSSFIPTPLAIVISFLSRVWITVFEIIVFFIGLFLKRLSARSRT